MPRAHARASRTAIRFISLVIALAAPTRACAQAVIFNSNGFETPTFNSGTITGQLGFQALPGGSAGSIQTTMVSTGTQAFQINGNLLLPNSTYGDANFWYKSYTVGGAYNPVVSGNPIVRVSFTGRISGALGIPSDIPFGGPYLEGYTSSGNPLDQQAITPILLNINDGITVFTNFSIGGSDGAVSTADQLFLRETWNTFEAQLNFSTQTFRVLLNGTPVTFTEGAFSSIDVPFRNTNGTTVSIAELGFQGYYNANFNPTFNNMYFDNFSVTAVSAVPEPSSFALAGIGVVGLAARFRRRK